MRFRLQPGTAASRNARPQETYFDCSGSWVPVIVDALAAAIAGIDTAAAYEQIGRSHNPHGVAPRSRPAFAVLFATSAIYGVTAVASCGRAKTARLERKQREELLPPPYGMPPWGEPPPCWPPPPLRRLPPAGAGGRTRGQRPHRRSRQHRPNAGGAASAHGATAGRAGLQTGAARPAPPLIGD